MLGAEAIKVSTLESVLVLAELGRVRSCVKGGGQEKQHTSSGVPGTYPEIVLFNLRPEQ